MLVAGTSGQLSVYPLDTITRIWFDLTGLATSAPMEPEATGAMMKVVHLFRNRPNPASLSTAIRFDIPTPGGVNLAVYDLTGAHVRTLVDGQLDSGEHAITWDGTNDEGRRVAGELRRSTKAGG